MPPPRITVLGSLNIDLVSYVPRHPQPGETLTSNSFSISPGGKGANQAAACAKLSRPRPRPHSHSSSSSFSPTTSIAMLGAVGSDPYGQTLLDALAAVQVDVSGISCAADTSTGVAVIIVDEPTGENRIILSPGANHILRPAAFLSLAALAEPDLLVMQLEIPLDTVAAAARTAYAGGVPVLLNAAPAPDAESADVLVRHVFPCLAHLVVNETEAAALCDANVAELDEQAGLERVAAWFVDRGVGTVVITLGARGAFWMVAAVAEGEGGGRSSGLVPAVPVAEVVDTTAAGDTFVGVYALRVADAAANEAVFGVEDAVRAAAVASALTVQRKGAQSSIPWGDELVV